MTTREVASDLTQAAAHAPKRNVRRWIVTIAVVVVPFLIWALLQDRDSATRPACHKGIMASFDDWQDKHKTKEFPNSRGSSDASIESLRENWWPDDHGEYMYVPGLRSDDPPNLVLMYLAKPTRWQWHAETRWIFREKEWIVIPVDFTFLRDGVRDGELNERLSTDEFRRRLKKTLEFLRANKRPHWEAVAQEHTGFLNTIKRDAD